MENIIAIAIMIAVTLSTTILVGLLGFWEDTKPVKVPKTDMDVSALWVETSYLEAMMEERPLLALSTVKVYS